MLAALSAACAYDASVLAAPILTGRLARAAVPDGLRHALTAESGTNDGLALPLVMLPVLLLQHPPAEAWTEWFVHVLLWEVGGAVLVGLAAGWFVGHGLRWARRRLEADKASLLTVTLALAVASLAGVRVLEQQGRQHDQGQCQAVVDPAFRRQRVAQAVRHGGACQASAPGSRLSSPRAAGPRAMPASVHASGSDTQSRSLTKPVVAPSAASSTKTQNASSQGSRIIGRPRPGTWARRRRCPRPG